MASAPKIAVAVRLKNEDAYVLARENKLIRNWELSKEENEGKPDVISYGYESYDVWGPGQDAPWQTDNFPMYGTDGHEGWLENRPVYVGYTVASTWNGIIEMNQPLMNAIDEKKSKLRQYFPNDKLIVVFAGKQN